MRTHLWKVWCADACCWVPALGGWEAVRERACASADGVGAKGNVRKRPLEKEYTGRGKWVRQHCYHAKGGVRERALGSRRSMLTRCWLYADPMLTPC